MQTNGLFLSLTLTLGFGLSPLANAQRIIATVPVGVAPLAVAINAASNKAYVANFNGNTVSVIDGATYFSTTVAVGAVPVALALNPATNKIYVVNYNSGTVTVIDGVTLSTHTVAVEASPRAIAINTLSNKIYVANAGDNSVTVIDGVTNHTTRVAVGNTPSAVAVNEVTNKIYVANFNDNTVTVIDGPTNNTANVVVGGNPIAISINPLTNKIYIANELSGTVTVISGSTLSTATVIVGRQPIAAAVNPVSNKIYVANQAGGTVTVIDGATNFTHSVVVGSSPTALALNFTSNKIYVANYSDNTVTTIDGATNSTATIAVQAEPVAVAANNLNNRMYVANFNSDTVSVIAGANSEPLQFVPLAPCRLFDTRSEGGPIAGGSFRDFVVPGGPCGVPARAGAYAVNVTVLPHGTLSYLTMWPTGEDQPLFSTMNSPDGRIRASAAIVPAGAGGALRVFVTNTTDVILDISGYFEPPGATLAFYPLPPCRILDTRNANGDLGGPFLNVGQERDFPLLESTCIPPGVTPQAYSLNFTVVPYNQEPLGYLTVWPTGQPQPGVSTLNNLTATIVANAAIVPAGTGGRIATFPSQNTQLVVDINGYFAAAGPGGLSLYPVAPCRVLDTRQGNGAFSGELSVDVANSVCAPSSTAQAYILNATVVPQNALGYLTLWADRQGQPLVSTLNAPDGVVSSNIALVSNLNGRTEAYASSITQLILDLSGYFAP